MFRRRGFRRRRFSKPVKRVQNAWSPFVFDRNAGTAEDGVAVMYALFDPAASDPAAVTDNNLQTRVRRIICSGGYALSPENSVTPLLVNTAIHAAVLVVDVEDTDADLITTTTGSLLVGHRVLWRQCVTRTIQQLALASGAVTPYPFDIPMDFDIKTNVKLSPDELIVLAIQFASNASGVLDDFPRLSVTGAVLFEVN